MSNNFKNLTQAEASQWLAAIVESSDDAIISKDLKGIITSWNQAAERLFGCTAEEAIGKPVTLLIPPERHDEESSILDSTKRGQRIEHYETIRRRKDGGFPDGLAH
jgi:PAS domain S-box-containing protein